MKRLFLLLLCLPIVADAAHFQDSNGLIIIRDNNGSEFRVESSEFPAYEATYEAPQDGAIRIWTDAYQALQKDGTQYGDPFYSAERFAGYVDSIATYQAAYAAAHLTPTPTPTPTPQPTIYADVQVSSDRLNVADGTMTFQATLQDADGNVLDVDDSWIIRLRDADGEEVDAIEIEFTDGATPLYTYSCPPEANLGRIHVDSADFDQVTVDGLGTFAVELLAPVEFTIYRSL